MNITGLTGVTVAQRAALLALGALDGETAQDAAAVRAAATVSLPPRQAEPSPLASNGPLTNVRAARTTFVGRAIDVAALSQVLEPTVPNGTRLLTLTGVAGSGKTRLGLAVAEPLRGVYRDGVWLVELAPLPATLDPDPSGVVAATLSSLRVHEQPGTPPMDTMIAHLQPKQLLLVLDNCEHLVRATAAVAARLLATCPELQILATSQVALSVAEETVWQVAPMEVPRELTGVPTQEDLNLMRQSDAVQLFITRARAVRPDFDFTSATAASVVAICQRLDGLPLAIELAAARLNVLPLEGILTRLDDRFQLLRRGGRTPGDRHQALRATMDWSYGLLTPPEQALLRRLAIFTGGWDISAAEQVCAGDVVSADSVLDLLDELLQRSLVQVHDVSGVPRYGSLETVRQYCLQQLKSAGEAAMVRDRHLDWYATVVEQITPRLLGQAAWLVRLDREQDNLRTALQRGVDRNLSAQGLRLATGLWQFWRTRGYYSEGRRWLAAVLALTTDKQDAMNQSLRASALEGAAWLAEIEHDFAQASSLFAESGTLRRALGRGTDDGDADKRRDGSAYRRGLRARHGSARREPCAASRATQPRRHHADRSGGLTLSTGSGPARAGRLCAGDCTR